MMIVTVADRMHFSSEKMQKVGLVESDRLFLDLYCLGPGQAQRAHIHPDSDKVYYVLRGRARVRIAEEEEDVAAGQAVLAPAGAPHGVSNATTEPLTLLVFMAPKPVH